MVKSRRVPGEQLVFNIIAQAPKAPRAAKSDKPKPKPPKFGKILEYAGARVKKAPSFDHALVLAFAKPAPGVVPKDQKLAMDSGFAAVTAWAGGQLGNFMFQEGYVFLGYPYLAELSVVPEYRLIGETIATESTRKWIKIKSKAQEEAEKADLAKKEIDEVLAGTQGIPGANPDQDGEAEATAGVKKPNDPKVNDKSDKIAELKEEFLRLDVKGKFRLASLYDSFFGRSHLYVDTGSTDDREELMTPIGDGNKFTGKKFKRGFLRDLKVVEPVWTYPQWYNSTDPLADDWYKPSIWYVMAKGVHVSRILPFISKPLPDILKPSYQFGGLSMIQMAKPYVDNWLETRQSVNDIIQAFSVMVLATNLSAILEESGDKVLERVQAFNAFRRNEGTFVIDKNTEDFKNIAAPIAGLSDLQAQAQEHMASISRIPLVKLTGISPKGLNATSEGELACFEDMIHAYQESFFGPHLRTIFRMAQLNIWGKIDPDLVFEFEPLEEMSEKDKIEMQKAVSEIHKNYIDMGAVDPEEVRESISNDENSLYPDIDPSDVPEPIVEPGNIHEKDEGSVGPDGEPAPAVPGQPGAKPPGGGGDGGEGGE